MRALKYLLVSLLVVSIVKRTRAEEMSTNQQKNVTPATQLLVKKGSKKVGYYIPDKKIVQSDQGTILFVNVIEEKKGNYTKVGFDEETLLLNKSNSTEILEKIGTAQHQRPLPQRPSKVILYGVRLKKPIIHTA